MRKAIIISQNSIRILLGIFFIVSAVMKVLSLDTFVMYVYTRVSVDAENYRGKREESLQRLARKMAAKVVKYKKNLTLEPMNAYERHVIHATLQDFPNVTTYSTGTEPNRRVIVAYVKEEQ